MTDPEHLRPPFLILAVLTALLALGAPGCGQQDGGDSPFGSNFGGGGGGDDDDDATAGGNETMSSAWIEVARVANLGAASAVIQAAASWYPERAVNILPPIANDLDGCMSGSGSAALYGIPDTELDVGLTVITMSDGDHVLEEEDDILRANLPYSSWEANQEFDIQTTGGEDLDAMELEGILGTPSSIALNSVESVDTGVTVLWLGGDNVNQIALRVTLEVDAVLYWVGCKVIDDGEYLLRSGDMVGLPPGLATLQIRREQTTTFEIAGQSPGTVVGATLATTAIEIVAAGDDDDSADDGPSGGTTP